MMNGKDRAHRQNGVALNGHGEHAGGDASDLYGDYEQELARELTELLRTAPPRGAQRAGIRAVPPGPPGEPHQIAAPGGHPPGGYGPGYQAADPHAHPGGVPAYVPAARPYNDFVDDGSRPPIPASWLAEPEPEAGGVGRHIKFGAAGFLAGLAMVVPIVLVMTGRLGGSSGEEPAVQRAVRAEVTAVPPPPASLAAASAVSAPQPIAPSEPPPAQAAAPPVSPPAQIQERQVRTEPVAVPPPPVPAPAPATALLQDPSVTANPTPSASPARTEPKEPPPPPLQALAERAPPPPPVDPVVELIASGARLIGAGNVSAAREAFSRAAATGNPEATMALAETFDPNMLAAWGARDIRADAAVARGLYTKALDAGIAKARVRLDALN